LIIFYILWGGENTKNGRQQLSVSGLKVSHLLLIFTLYQKKRKC